MNEKPSPESERQPKASWREKTVISVILLLMVISLCLLFYPPAFLQNTAPTIDPSKQIADPHIGDMNAPVRIIEYSDFACLKCREWHQSGVLNQILEKYGEQVVFIWRDLPTVSVYTARAAEAGQCANEQGKFWEYHDFLYGKPEGFMDVKLIEYAKNLGLDANQFGGCLINSKYADKLLSNRQQAYQDKVRVSPTFVVNGKRIVGPASFNDLSGAIEEALKAKSEGSS